MNNRQITNTNKGFTLMETIIYFSLLSVISVMVIGSIISLFKNYGVIKTNQQIENNAITILDKMTRDVRSARSVLISQSSFSIPQGVLTLDIASSTNENASNTVKYYLNNGKIKYAKDGVDLGNLSTSDVSVSNFRMYYITTPVSEAIKVELTIDSIPHMYTAPISKNFYTTIQLRE